MKIRRFPAAVMRAATLAALVSLTTLVVAQDSTPPSLAAGAPAVDKVALSSGAEDVLKLARAKVNDEVTIAFIQNSNRRYDLSASEILYLRKEGVSDRVLTTMLGQTPPPPQTPPPQPATTAFAAEASAPQYILQPSVSNVETVRVSTVFVETSSFNSFCNPWPFWSCWSPSPVFSFGWGWGWGCGWGWGGCGNWRNPSCFNGNWNNYCGSYPPPPPDGNPPPPANGNRPPPPNSTGNPSSINGRTGGQGTIASDGRQVRGVNQSPAPVPAASGANRVESRPANGRPTSYWSNNGNQTTTARTSASQANVANQSQPTRPSLGSSGMNTRTATGRPNASPTSVWSGNSRQESPRAAANQRATSVARPSPSSSAPTAVGSRPTNPSANSYSARPTMNYQRSTSFSPSNNYRSSGSAPSVSRPSMSPSFSRPSMPSSSPSMGSAGASRGGGSSSGAGAPRMSSGGGVRGGGGGGRSR